MPTANVVPASKVLVQLGNGATPTEVFATPAGLSTNAIALDGGVVEFSTLNDDGWIGRLRSTKSVGVTGSGYLVTTDLANWRDWWMEGDARNARMIIDEDHADGGYFQGKFILQSLNIGATANDLTSLEATIQSHGVVTWTDAV